NRKTDSLICSAVGKDHAIDANNLPIHVYQRPTGVAWIYRSIGLDKTIKRCFGADIAPDRADNSRSQRLFKPKWTSQGQNPITLLNLVRIAKRNGRQIGRVDFDYRQICFRIRSDFGGFKLSAVRELNLNFGRFS